MNITIRMDKPPVKADAGEPSIKGVAVLTFHEPSLEKPFEIKCPADDRYEAVRLWPEIKARLLDAEDPAEEVPDAVRRALRSDTYCIV